MKLLASMSVFGVVALLNAWSAQAQDRPDTSVAGFRSDAPAVNPLRPPADPDAASNQITSTFRRWYASANHPAMLIFWNRELTDDATTRFADTSVSHEEVRASKDGTGGKDAVKTSETDASSKVTSQETSKRILTGGEHVTLDPMLSARMDSAFEAAWLGVGVELVDRNAIIRKMSTVASKEDRGDTQLLESVSLGQGIEYLVEVLPNPSAQSATGLVFLVKVKHLPSATLVAQFLSSAQPPRGPAYWAAKESGFSQQSDDRTSPETIGAELAVEVMQRMAR